MNKNTSFALPLFLILLSRETVVGPQKELLNYICRQTNLPESKATAAVKMVRQAETHFQRYPSLSYKFVTNFIKKKHLKTGCEIGVAYGGMSLAILRNTAVTKLYSIDPHYGACHLPEAHGGVEKLNKLLFNLGLNGKIITEVMHCLVRYELATFGERSVFIRATSFDAIKEFQSNSLDFVYVDGDHGYEPTKRHIVEWWPILRSGGYLIFDDYGCAKWAGVKKAVDEFSRRTKLPIIKLAPRKVAIQKPTT